MLVAPAHENPEEVDDENLPMATVVIPLDAYTRAHAAGFAAGSAAGSSGATKQESGSSRAVVPSLDEAPTKDAASERLHEETYPPDGCDDENCNMCYEPCTPSERLHEETYPDGCDDENCNMCYEEEDRDEGVQEDNELASLLARIRAAKVANDCRGVVDAMKAGASSAKVAENGCDALLRLAYNNDDNKKRIAEAGGIGMILRMMEVHGSSNAEVAECGSSALSFISYNNDDNKKRIAEADGIAMILRMMEEHGASNAAVAEYGCGALWMLSYDNDDNKRKILAANGVSMVERMKSTWASNEGVQEMVDGALAILR